MWPSARVSRRSFLRSAGLGAGLVGVSMLAACAPASPAAPAAPPTAAAAAKAASGAQTSPGTSGGLNLSGATVRYLTIPDVESSGREAAKEFEQMYGAKVDFALLPTLQLRDKLLSEYVAKTGAYDVVNISPWWIGEFGPFLEPIDQYLNDPKVAQSDFNLADFPDDLLKAYVTYNDRIVGLPSHVDLMMLLYRSDLFSDPKEKDAYKQAYGAELAVPKTWDDFEKAATFFTRPDAQLWGVAAMGKRTHQIGAQWINRFFANGGAYFDAKNKPTINSQAGVKATEQVDKAIKQWATPGVLTYDFAEARQAFWEGKAAMMEAWPGSVLVGGADPQQSKIVGKFNGTIMPGGHGCGGGWFFGVSADSKNKVAAYKFVELLSTKKYQQLSYTQNGRMPSRQSAYAENYITSTLPTGFAEQFKLAAAGSFPPPNKFPEDAELQDELDRYVSEVVAGTRSASQAMTEANQSWESILQRAGRLG